MPNKSIDILLIISLASLVSITLPMSCVVISDYKDTRNYADGICNGSSLTNFTIEQGLFYHGVVNVVANVNGTEYNGFLYYPPIKHWQFAFISRTGIIYWYDSLNKTGSFKCFVDLNNPTHPMVNEWIEIIGYYILLLTCLVIITGLCTMSCMAYDSKQRRPYISIPDDLPPPYTPTQIQINQQPQSLYKTLNDELTTISV